MVLGTTGPQPQLGMAARSMSLARSMPARLQAWREGRRHSTLHCIGTEPAPRTPLATTGAS